MERTGVGANAVPPAQPRSGENNRTADTGEQAPSTACEKRAVSNLFDLFISLKNWLIKATLLI